MPKMKYLRGELERFSLDDFYIKSEIKNSLFIFLWWSIPALAFVVLVKYFGSFRATEYYGKAISEGIGPALWNVMGSFGIAFLGLSIIFKRSTWFSIAANKILMNVYSIGCLTFGLIFGQFICLLPELDNYLQGWRLFLFAPTISILLLALVIINLCIWCLSCFSKRDSSLNIRLCNMHWGVRIFIGLLIVYAPLQFLWLEN